VARPDDVTDAEPDPESVARTICLKMLTARARTRAELADELTKRNVPESAAMTVLDALARVGLIDDAAFAASFAAARHADRGLARREIERQLRIKGVELEIAKRAALGISEHDERTTARRLAERKSEGMTRIEEHKKVRRLVGMLARKGYSPELALNVALDVVQMRDDEGFQADSP
jgi:regulatory protein